MTRSFFTLALTALSLALGVGPTRADYTTSFSSPPYTIDQSAIGIDGWEYRLPTTEDLSERSRVVAVRWNDYKPALMLKGANLKNTFPATKGTRATITFDAAFAFPDRGGTGKQFRMGFLGAPTGEFFIDLGNEGGLGYLADGSGKGGNVVVKKAEVKMNSFYRFVVKVDYSAMTYEVSISGKNKEGTPFLFTSGKADFQTKAKGVTGLYLLSGANVTAYLGDITVQSE